MEVSSDCGPIYYSFALAMVFLPYWIGLAQSAESEIELRY